MTRQQSGKNPKNLIIDGLASFRQILKVFGKKTNHVKRIYLVGKRDRDINNERKRLNERKEIVRRYSEG